MSDIAVGDIAHLVRLARAGDDRAWNRLVTRFRGLLGAIARSYRLPSSDAEDVEQTTWLRLFESIDRLRQPESLPGWLATTARRECLRVLKLEAREAPTENVESRVDDSEVLPAPGDELLEQETHAMLWDAVHELPPRHQRLLETLLTAPTPSYVDVARSLDMPIGSIGPTRARSIDRLRRDPRIVALAV